MIVESVNVGGTVPVPWGRMKRSAIDRRPVAGPVRMHREHALLEVSGVRIPCAVFGGFMNEARWVKRFTGKRCRGAYLRVIVEGCVSAGDEIAVVERRNHELTVGFAFQALTTVHSRAGELLVEPRISERVRKRATWE